MVFSQRTLLIVLATGGGAGYVPGLPGTAGTVVAIPLSIIVNRIAAAHLPLALLTLVVFLLLAVWAAGKGEELFEKKDAQRIVIDEVAGFLVAGFLAQGFKFIALAFLLFRFFDIIKPYPARRMERIHGGWGVVLDDLVAGLYSFLALRLLAGWELL